MSRVGVLLINLGTPEGTPGVGPSEEQVRTYLDEFLMDPYVIDLPYPLRWLLVRGVILRTRPAASAAAYRKIWTKDGSPLKHYHLKLIDAVQESIGNDYRVVPAMRYGTPSIPSALALLQSEGIREVILAPLYPQYSLAATESSLAECRRWIAQNDPSMKTRVLPPFFKDPGFIGAFSGIAQESLRGFAFDHLLFSFHGLPERHVRKTDPTRRHCLVKEDCCQVSCDQGEERDCYRAQCFTTAREMARLLGLTQDRYTVCFQSRLNSRWIRPHTDVVYRELAARGVKKIAVLCPAFVADCLETLEEIGIRAREDFVAAGGEELRWVPSLNFSPAWVSALSQMLMKTLRGDS